MGIQILQFIGNRYAGFILTMIVIINLAIGSLVMNLNADIYPAFFPFDLNFFFMPLSKVHLWLYILLITFTLFTINLMACFVLDFLRLMNRQNRTLKKIIAFLFHFSLLLALLAHLYEGFYGDSGHTMLSETPIQVEGIGEINLLSSITKTHPDGSKKDIIAKIQIRNSEGEKIEKTLSYNQPAIFEWGNREIIIQGAGNQPKGLVLRGNKNGKQIYLNFGESKTIKGGTLLLHGVFQARMGFHFAEFTWSPLAGKSESKMMVIGQVAGRHNQIQILDETYRFAGALNSPYIAALVRYNPSIPIIILSMFFIFLGMILLGRFIFRRKQPNEAI